MFHLWKSLLQHLKNTHEYSVVRLLSMRFNLLFGLLLWTIFGNMLKAKKTYILWSLSIDPWRSLKSRRRGKSSSPPDGKQSFVLRGFNHYRGYFGNKLVGLVFCCSWFLSSSFCFVLLSSFVNPSGLTIWGDEGLKFGYWGFTPLQFLVRPKVPASWELFCKGFGFASLLCYISLTR